MQGVLVLIVEDDEAIAAPLGDALRREGYEVRRVATGSEALAMGAAVDVVLLDLRLPDVDGYTVCRELRACSRVPIIILSARGEEADRVIGLELGADDYLVKPFGLRELVARIRAVLRRADAADSGQACAPRRLVVDRRTRRASVDGLPLALTPKEFDLLAQLAADPGAVVSRQRLLAQVWDTSWCGSSKTIDVHVASLRRKLGSPAWIETVRGVGFRLAEPA
jgi:DNA-binding response OmpR family regulator